MNDALKAYLEQEGGTELDQDLIQAHLRAMTEEVVPAIVDDLVEADQVAAELRFSSATTRRRDR
jgi:hypothetical protein